MFKDNIEQLEYYFSRMGKYYDFSSSEMINLAKSLNFIVESIGMSEEKPKNREITYDDLWNGVSEV